ncbi:MAG: DUF924 domain-containing protein [Proteobacteria bacterium]|jgi:uncharacterized protein (DUF924 family)|nr:DUF924 domain-containing protein [Pseudomonadota bacterium]
MHKEVLRFWFSECTPEQWFKKDLAFDNIIKSRFLETYENAILGRFHFWSKAPHSLLALIIILDQFPRNLFRNDKLSFAHDRKALELSKIIQGKQFIAKLSDDEKLFALLPIIHSEDINDHELTPKILKEHLSTHPRFEQIRTSWSNHTKAIKRFGRYPHRNATLGRKNTPEETVFLKGPNSAW